jgi:hypothetical protein
MGGIHGEPRIEIAMFHSRAFLAAQAREPAFRLLLDRFHVVVGIHGGSLTHASRQRSAAHRQGMGNLVFDSALGRAEAARNVAITQALEPVQQENFAAAWRQCQNRALQRDEILVIREVAVGLRRLGYKFLIVKRAMVVRAARLRISSAVRHYARGNAKQQRTSFAWVVDRLIAQHAQECFLYRVLGGIDASELTHQVPAQGGPKLLPHLRERRIVSHGNPIAAFRGGSA